MWGRAVLAAGLLVLVPTAAARAGTVSQVGSTITYQAVASTGTGETVGVGIDTSSGNNGYVTTDQSLTSSSPCSDNGSSALCDGVPTTFVVNMLGFNDSVNANGVAAFPSILVAHGGGGDDYLDGSVNGDQLFGDDGIDYLFGYEGNDTLDGGAGTDYITDGPGNDTVTGGPGDDSLTAGTGTDVVSGGDGNDTIDYSARTAPVTITLDGVAGSGEAGENDTIAADVENAVGGSGGDRIVGNASDNYLTGNEGNDTIVGGGGSDTIQSGPGDDTIDTRDGVYDSVDCGPGNDVVYADLGDSTTNCEVAPDPDGDGYIAPADCGPNDPNIHPGAPEIYGNDVDEDCKDGPGYLLIPDGINFKWKGAKSTRGAVLTQLRITSVHAGDAIRVTCKGGKSKGCPYKSKSATGQAGHPTVNLLGPFKKRVLRPGAVITVSVTVPEQIGRVIRYTVRKSGRSVSVSNLSQCLRPHATAPSHC